MNRTRPHTSSLRLDLRLRARGSTKDRTSPRGRSHSTIRFSKRQDSLRCRSGANCPKATPELLSKYPLLLSDHHTSRSYNASWLHHVPCLREVEPYPSLHIHPDTATERGIADGDWVTVEGLHGTMKIKAMHYPGIRQDVVMLLTGALSGDYAVTTAANGAEAMQLLSARNFDLVITDDRMPVMSGIELLRALQEQQFERLGGTRTIAVDVRVVAATNKDLRQALQEKTFRDDLYYRLNVFPIHIPPLREWREDILPLAQHFGSKIAARMGRPFRSFHPAAERLLIQMDWPGNVRELQNAVERALIIARTEVIGAADLPFQPDSAPEQHRRGGTLGEVEREFILEVLARNNGERRATADELGISLRTLQYRLKECGLAGKE